MKTAVRMGTALVRGVNTQRRCCSGDVDLPSVVLLEGDAFVTDSFAKVKTDPKWVLDSMQGAVESEFYDRGIKKYENLAGWKPLSSTVNHLTCTHNLKVQGWSRHPQDTSKMVYALLNDAKSRSSPTTVIPHYQLDRVRDHWAKSEDNVPLYADIHACLPRVRHVNFFFILFFLHTATSRMCRATPPPAAPRWPTQSRNENSNPSTTSLCPQHAPSRSATCLRCSQSLQGSVTKTGGALLRAIPRPCCSSTLKKHRATKRRRAPRSRALRLSQCC